MPPNPALRKLMDAEASLGLMDRRVLGVPVWPLERLLHYRKELLALEGGTEGPTEQRTNPASNIARRVWRSLADLAEGEPASRPGRDIWVLSSSNYRRPDSKGGNEVAFTEHLRAQLGERLLFIERNHAALPRQHRDDVLFVDAALVAAEAAGRLAGPALSHTPLGRDAKGTPADAALLCTGAVYGRLLLALARRWIRRAPPRAVFVLNGYHLFIPFQIAAKEARIPVIELQHGIIHESHPGYVFQGEPRSLHLPDHLVVFGRHFGELLERESPYWRGRWTVGGHPWLKLKRAGVEDVPDGALDSVVVFSQPNAPIREQLRTLLPELRARLPGGVCLILKPHPRELDAAAFYASAATSGVILESPRTDTYDLLRRCKVAVSVASTVGIEALAFRCRSLVLETPFRLDDLEALVQSGALVAARDAGHIAELAALPPTRDTDLDLATRLFGVRQPEPDFQRLIHTVSQQLP